MLAANPYFKVQVRPGRNAGAAYGADRIAGQYGVALGDADRVQVKITGVVAVFLCDDDAVPVAPEIGRRRDGAAAGGVDRRAGRRGEIDALVIIAGRHPAIAGDVDADGCARAVGAGDRFCVFEGIVVIAVL